MRLISGRGALTKGDVFIFPKDEKLTMDDLQGFLNVQQELYRKHYKRNYDIYIGKHKILNKPDSDYGEDNKLVVGMPRLLVDEYTGYFGGNAVTIQAKDDSDNEAIQKWLKEVNFDDEHSEVVKSVAIYGRSYLLEYQDEEGHPQVAHVEADEGFMIYDDSIKAKPLAFVRYSYDYENELKGTIYYAGETQDFQDGNLLDPQPSVYHDVPAQELYSNEERQGVFDAAVTLIEALDNALSRKANQVDYFDEAYLVMLGLDFSETDENGNPVGVQINRRQKTIIAPDIDAVNARIEFLGKPDGDTMQENLINRLVNMIYQTSMIPNFQDEAFSGNSSGVALQFKLLPMQNLAAFQERKFTNALRSMFKAVFESADGGQVVQSSHSSVWKEVEFTYTRNIPQNIADAVQTAVQASSLLSQQTAIGMIPTVTDPQAEIEKKQKEQQEQVQANMANVPDYMTVGDDEDEG